MHLIFIIAAALLFQIGNFANAALPISFAAFEPLHRGVRQHNGARIRSLPGFNGKFPSKHYGGYITGAFLSAGACGGE